MGLGKGRSAVRGGAGVVLPLYQVRIESRSHVVPFDKRALGGHAI